MSEWDSNRWADRDTVGWRLIAACVILTAVVSIAAGSWLGWISHAYL